MRSSNSSRALSCALMLSLFAAVPARAAEAWLVAQPFDQTMPDGRSVRMWGFARATPGFASVEAPASPGPALEVPATDGELVVQLRNDLDVAISLVIPALTTALDPARTVDARGRSRITSFAAETGPGSTGTYRWSGLRPGTFLYMSGSNPSVQVQMGLFGAVTRDAAAGQAYPGVPYDLQALLVYSEIDPDLHDAVANGTYGSAAYPSAVKYAARYYLINGRSAPDGAALLARPLATNERLLLRLVNAGFESHVPTLQGGDLQIVAENGRPYSWAKQAYSALMPANNTVDAVLSVDQAGRYALYDGRLFLTHPGGGAGGMKVSFEAAVPAGAPVAADDMFHLMEDQPFAPPAPGVLGNDTGSGLTAQLVQGPRNGALQLNADGSFTYTPAADFVGQDLFSYRAVSAGFASNEAVVTLHVMNTNDAPIAMDDFGLTMAGQAVAVPVLANDMDPDGDALSVTSFTQGAFGTVALLPDGSLAYLPAVGFVGTDSFMYVADDGTAASDPALVTVTVIPRVNTAPTANDDWASTPKNTAVLIDVLANDVDPDGALDPSTVVVVVAPTRGGTATVQPGGEIRFVPRMNFRGTDLFTYQVRDRDGARSNEATVRVNVQ